MKKLFALLFTFALAFSLAMPVFAQDTGAATPAPKAEKKKAKKAKKEKKADKTAAAPTQ
jgi:hypothetical protein